MRESLPFSKEDVLRWNAQYPTPFYVYDEEGIRACVDALYKAFSWNKGFREYFAVKATPTPAILRILKEYGCGTDCASAAELIMSERSGIDGHRIMFSSNETRIDEYKEALRLGAIINLDDITQIAQLERAGQIPDTVCCRYNPGQFENTNGIMGHAYDSKFGMNFDQLKESYRILKEKGAKHFGIHSMVASCCLDNNYYPSLAEKLFDIAVELRNELDIEIEFIDLAGGIGIPYRPEEQPVDISAVGEGVRKAYEKIIEPAGLSISIFTEMGRYITGPYGYLVTKVIGEKHIYKDYVGVDATACNLMRPAIYGAYHNIRILGKENAPKTCKVDVVGSLCENNDKFAVDRELPEAEYGDYIVIEDAGAHGHSMGYNYNGKLRSAELLMHKDRSVSCIRRAQTLDDYFATLDIDKDF